VNSSSRNPINRHRESAKEEELETIMFEGLFQPMHLLLIAGIALMIFGPKKLPELGKGIGEGIRGFKQSLHPTDKPAESANKVDADQTA
jgi:sec-independent protein translocase protein TatA